MLVALTVLLGCSPTPAPAPPQAAAPLRPVRIGLDWFAEPEFGGYYQAWLDGTYKAAGLSVDLVPGGPGVPVLEMLGSGKLDVAVSGAENLLLRRAQGLDAVAVYPGFQDSPVGLLAHDGGPASFAEIRGPVAIENGSAFQLFLWGKFGWEGKVAMVPTTGQLGPFAADPTLVQQGYVTSEPCVAESMGLKTKFLPARDAGWNPYAALAVVAGKEADQPWVTAFYEASRKGWQAYLADPNAANAVIAAQNPEMKGERLTCIIQRQTPFVTGTDGLGVMTEARWQAIAAAMNGVGQKVDAAGAWRPTPGAPGAQPAGVPAPSAPATGAP